MTIDKTCLLVYYKIVCTRIINTVEGKRKEKEENEDDGYQKMVFVFCLLLLILLAYEGERGNKAWEDVYNIYFVYYVCVFVFLYIKKELFNTK